MQKHFPNIFDKQPDWHETKNEHHLVESNDNIKKNSNETAKTEPIKDHFCAKHGQMFTLHDLIEYIHETELCEDWNELHFTNGTDSVLIKPFICKFIRKIFAKHAELTGTFHVTSHQYTNPSKLLGAIDSIELLNIAKNLKLSENSNSGSDDAVSMPSTIVETEISPRKTKRHKRSTALVYDFITADDYIDSIRKVPPYMLDENRRIPSIWNYKPVTDNEWKEIINGFKLSENAKDVASNFFDNRPSCGSSKKVQVCHSSVNIPNKENKELKKLDLDKTPTRSILRFSKS